MRELTIVLKSTLADGTHEQISILDVGSAKISDPYLLIYSDEILEAHPPMGRFDLADIVGYWIEDS